MPEAFQSSYDQYRDPVVVLYINGKPADDIVQHMTSFEMEESKKLPHVKMALVDPDGVFINDSRLDLGTIWSVRFGYPNDMSSIQDFRLAYFEPKYPPNAMPTIDVTLLHSAVSMMKVSSGRHWGKVQSSDIAKRIAARHKLKAVVEPSKDNQTSYTQPHTMKDFEYLTHLAERIDYEFFVDGNKLYYRSNDFARRQAPRITFTYGGADQVSMMKEFHPTIKSHHGKKVHILGADTSKGKSDPKGVAKDTQKPGAGASPKQIDAATGATSTAPDQVTWDLEAGDLLGFEAASAAASSATTPETDKSKVDKHTKAKHRDFLERAVKAEAEFIGSPQIRAKVTYTIQGIDRRLSGHWYSKESEHKIEGGSYTTRTKLHRGSYTAGNKKQAADKKAAGTGGPVAGSGTDVLKIDLPTGAQWFDEDPPLAVPPR